LSVNNMMIEVETKLREKGGHVDKKIGITVLKLTNWFVKAVAGKRVFRMNNPLKLQISDSKQTLNTYDQKHQRPEPGDDMSTLSF